MRKDNSEVKNKKFKLQKGKDIIGIEKNELLNILRTLK